MDVVQGGRFFCSGNRGLLNALFAEASALGGTLAGLEFRVALTNDV